MMRRRTAWGFLVTAALVLLTGCHAMGEPSQKGQSNMRIHYLEIVCRDVAAECAALERIHGVSFGPAVADLGQARVAKAPDGSLIGVRAPLAEHEQPITRTYLEVTDIERAVKEAEAAGAEIAYPPTRQGDTGTWAIYFLGDVQIGLWQRSPEELNP
jgi:predicted enzyme related to lactoylglutathione lyase